MRETFDRTINGRLYKIRMLGGSWKQKIKIMNAKNQKLIREIAPDLKIPDPKSEKYKEFITSDEYINFALEMTARLTEEDIKNTKDLIKESVTAPKLINSTKEDEIEDFEDGYEAYFSMYDDDLVPLEIEIIKINLGEAEKKTQDTGKSEQTQN